MKSLIIFKILFVLPLILLVDYILMVIIGCATCLFGFNNDFYCGSYCIFGKVILALSAVFFLFYIAADLKAMMKKN